MLTTTLTKTMTMRLGTLSVWLIVVLLWPAVFWRSTATTRTAPLTKREERNDDNNVDNDDKSSEDSNEDEDEDDDEDKEDCWDNIVISFTSRTYWQMFVLVLINSTNLSRDFEVSLLSTSTIALTTTLTPRRGTLLVLTTHIRT